MLFVRYRRLPFFFRILRIDDRNIFLAFYLRPIADIYTIPSPYAESADTISSAPLSACTLISRFFFGSVFLFRRTLHHRSVDIR